MENEEIIFENENDVIERLNKIKIYFKKLKYNEKSILISSHSDIIWNITKFKKGDEYFGKWLKNGEILEFEI